MSSNFTEQINKSIWEIDASEEDVINAIEYLNNPKYFRPFSVGITELMVKCGYTKATDDTNAKVNYLLDKFHNIGASITKATIKSWLTDTSRSASVSNSRTKMFQLCFALSANFDDVIWFFNHIYFNRSFNCHTIEEAVYYYCFLNNLSYPYARDLIQKIKQLPDNSDSQKQISPTIFTEEIRKQLGKYKTDEELLSFFHDNKYIFSNWNKTATLYINRYLKEIIGSEDTKPIIDKLKKTLKKKLNSTTTLNQQNDINENDIRKCGLLIREIYTEALQNNTESPVNYIFETINGRKLFSIDFVLERILYTSSGLPKNTPIPYIVKNNFPSKKTFSKILDDVNISISTSYDSIRKCLLLLQFYRFWCIKYIEPQKYSSYGYNDFVEETNAILIECGYEELFAGNPYDWLFLWASTTEQPLFALREVIGQISLDCMD